MKIIIIESELYLAQSISTKLDKFNYETEIYSSVKEAMNTNGDIYLLSTTIPNQDPIKLIEKFKDKIILLMVNYINNDTVGRPLKKGAKDYLVKPFVIEELVRKIEHYSSYKMLERQNAFYNDLLNSIFKEIELPIDVTKIKLPIVIYTNHQRVADKLAIDIGKNYGRALRYIDLQSDNYLKEIQKLGGKKIGYLSRLDKVKKDDREKLFELLEDKKFIMSSLDEDIETPFESVIANSSNKMYDSNNILTINEYVQYVIKEFQYQYPDTELSKKLGISRKSLWEKRRKFELFKKK